MPPRFYRIQANRFVPWGDYGSILQHGMTGRLGRVDGLLSLERTGPYMPPITFPGIGDVVLSSGGRALLEDPPQNPVPIGLRILGNQVTAGGQALRVVDQNGQAMASRARFAAQVRHVRHRQADV